MWKQVMVLGLIVGSSQVWAAAPTGDTRGKVETVRVMHNEGKGTNRFQIWFSSVENDRFNCLSANGYITVREDDPYVTPESYKLMFQIALEAQKTGNTLAVDSSANNSCQSVNQAWMLN